MTWTAEMKRQFQAKRKDRLKSLGLCVDCGKFPAKTGHVLCESCTEERRERYRRSQAKKLVMDAFNDVKNVDLIVAKAEKIAQLRRWSA